MTQPNQNDNLLARLVVALDEADAHLNARPFVESGRQTERMEYVRERIHDAREISQAIQAATQEETT